MQLSLGFMQEVKSDTAGSESVSYELCFHTNLQQKKIGCSLRT